VSLLVGILALAAPSIVGVSTPSFASWILAIVCFVVTAIQPLGFIGVTKEKSILYRRYVTLHGLAISVAFSVAAAWIIVSATRHSNAEAKCIRDFFSTGSTASEGGTLCNIFPWVDVGIMGALWVLLAILQLYLFVILSSYGTAQRRDHDQYDRVYDPSQPLTAENIPLDRAADPWDSRPSVELRVTEDPKYQHYRNQSTLSASDIVHQKPEDYVSHYRPSYP